MGCFSCIRCSCGGKCMGCCSCSTCSCGGKCTGCSSCITCSCWGRCIGSSSCSGCKDGGKCNGCPSCSGCSNGGKCNGCSCSGCSNGGKCIGCPSCSGGCSNGGKCMSCSCCCKSSNEEKDPTRRKKKWNPFSCCHKSRHKAKEPSTRPEKEEKKEKEKEEGKKEKKEKEEEEKKEKKEKKEKEEEEEEKKGTKSCLCIGKCRCERKKSPPSGEVKERKKDKKKKKRSCLSCLVCRGEKGLCCSCCGKSSDENKKPPEEKEEEEKEQREGKKRKGPKCRLCCAKSSDEESKKKKKREPRKGSSLAFLVHNMSFKSDDGKHKSDASEILRIGNGNIAARMFQFQELAVATENFKSECLLGEGGFGRVYQGYFADTNQIVAVKQLDRNGFQGNREFLVEVLMLSLLHHPNLVNLLGYCADGEQRILVYEYMSLGSLEDHLLAHTPNSKPLDWNARMKIALGAAKGIEYLHDIANPPVIYRDLKASNILLDEEYNPKLSDFGLAKLGPIGDKTHVSTRVMGTYGYCAPEYALTGQLTKMSDVYSFGVVFLELITGRRAIDITRPTHEQHLVQWAGPLFKDKSRFPEMADPLLQGKFPLKGMYQALAVAAMCLQEEATIRPRMSDVVTALEYLSLPFDISTEGSKVISSEGTSPRLSLSASSEVERSTNGNEGKPEEESCNSRREIEEDVDMKVLDTIDDGNTRLRES